MGTKSKERGQVWGQSHKNWIKDDRAVTKAKDWGQSQMNKRKGDQLETIML